MSKQRSAHAVWLDAIRGIASLVVFLGHARVVLMGSMVVAVGQANLAAVAISHNQPPEMTDFAHMAVIVSFVLSGYLVGGGALQALRSGRWSASNYAIARISRLWTVLIPILLLGYVLDHVGVELAQPGSIYFARRASAWCSLIFHKR